jgi:hypothetical protein
MAMERVAAIIHLAAQDTGFLSALGQQPDRLQSTLGLTDDHVAALRSASAFAVPLASGESVAGGVFLGSATLYPPEGTGTMDPGYVIISSPATGAPYTSPGPPPLGVAPRAVPWTTVPAPHAMPVPMVTPPYSVVPRPAPVQPPSQAPSVVAPQQPAAGPQVPAAPVAAPGSVVPAPCVEPVQPQYVIERRVGCPPDPCRQASIAAIVAAVSETAIPAITAIAGLDG